MLSTTVENFIFKCLALRFKYCCGNEATCPNPLNVGLIWDEAEEIAYSRSCSWRQRVAQCVFDIGSTQVSRCKLSTFRKSSCNGVTMASYTEKLSSFSTKVYD